MPVTALDHVQLAIPPGREAAARAFYAGLLGIPEAPKPPNLTHRGGCWFERGALKVHLGIEVEFRPARKAHPAGHGRFKRRRWTTWPRSLRRWPPPGIPPAPTSR